MLSEMRGRLWYVIKSVAPLIGVICLLQVTVVQAPAALFMQFLFGSALMILGLVLLFFGVDMGILPMGRFIGAAIPRKGSLTLIIAVGFAMGFATTIAEPDVMVLAAQVDEVTHGSISRVTVLYVVAIGVAVFVALGMARIVFGVSFRLLLTVSFLSILLVSAIAPAQFVHGGQAGEASAKHGDAMGHEEGRREGRQARLAPHRPASIRVSSVAGC